MTASPATLMTLGQDMARSLKHLDDNEALVVACGAVDEILRQRFPNSARAAVLASQTILANALGVEL